MKELRKGFRHPGFWERCGGLGAEVCRPGGMALINWLLPEKSSMALLLGSPWSPKRHWPLEDGSVHGFFGTESTAEFSFISSLQIGCGIMLLWCWKEKKNPWMRYVEHRKECHHCVCGMDWDLRQFSTKVY